jgi:Reverse transcriptase (RNA-dependent DNA polymerase)
MVADGHLTDILLDSVYSGVVSLRGLRTLLFIAELNGLEAWATDVGNAYLEANTKAKVYIVAGSVFVNLEGHILVISKALYGLRTSGLHWHECFADCLCDIRFFQSKAEADIWMRNRMTSMSTSVFMLMT